ncbi:MAG: hypothetical protein Q9163_004367 [Psora crenata]
MSSFGYYPTPKSPEMTSSRTSSIFDQHNPQSAARESPHQQNLPTPPSATTSSKGHYSPDGQFKVVRKRNRVPLSCAPCRNRNNRRRQTTSTSSTSSPNDMQNRIDRLEGLVLSLMTNGAQSAGPTAATRALSMDSSSDSMQYPADINIDGSENSTAARGECSEESETDQVVQSLGVMKVDNNKSMYCGDAHWAAILCDITEVKNYFAEHKKQYDDQMAKVQQAKARMDATVQGPMFLFGGTKIPQVHEALAQMPKRTVTDKLVVRYFNSYDPAVHILHPPSWYRIYEKYWENPEGMDPAWLGQLFAILCLAMDSYHRMDDEPPEYRGKSLALAAHYRGLTGQCLLLADFTKPSNYIIETMVLHLHCEYARSRDTEVGVWVLVGIIVRLAMRMGYHRDPKYFPDITPFQGELRRRVWTFVRQSDLLFSFQIGLPSMVRIGDSDAELPRNLFDEEFDEDTQVLPSSRPPSEPTPVSYMRAKAIMSYAFGKVVEQLHRVTCCSYDEIMELDQSLRDALAESPPHLRMRNFEDSKEDPGALVMQRFNLSILYHKGQCVLHRKFLHKARENARYAHSRRTCIDSSMELLSHQATLHNHSRRGHRLHGMKVFISSLTAADFLLAAMIVALDLCYGSETENDSKPSGDVSTWGSERRSDMIRALEVSIEIWKEKSDQSIEAYKASKILTVMLKKMRCNRAQQGHGAQNPFTFPSVSNTSENGQAFSSAVEEKPEHSAAMTLGMLSSGGIGSNNAPQYNGAFPSMSDDTSMVNMQTSTAHTPAFPIDQTPNGLQPTGSPFNFLGAALLPGMDSNGDVNIDWDAWDSYIQNVNIELPPNHEQAATAQELRPLQPWPASVDPSLATSTSNSQEQPAHTISNTYMGSNVPL